MIREDVWLAKDLVSPKQEYGVVFSIKCSENASPDNEGFPEILCKATSIRMQYPGWNFDPEETFRPKSSRETTRRAQSTSLQNDLVRIGLVVFLEFSTEFNFTTIPARIVWTVSETSILVLGKGCFFDIQLLPWGLRHMMIRISAYARNKRTFAAFS